MARDPAVALVGVRPPAGKLPVMDPWGLLKDTAIADVGRLILLGRRGLGASGVASAGVHVGKPDLMISIVLYGRNDSYGYNLHKRAALGINCMAEILTDEDDEILFVDYNTPDDYPTFPEAIADTLTARPWPGCASSACARAIHDRWKERTHLKAIEPIARNVAIRRSNPRNRWILSTNTDMIFVPRAPGSRSSDIASDLPTGSITSRASSCRSRCGRGSTGEIPPVSSNRCDCSAGRCSSTRSSTGTTYIKYDGPGDFQLMARDDLFRIHGFNEDMLLGWHVDSNIAKRLHLLHGHVSDVVERLFGYHCDHTRQMTAAHQHKADRNDLGIFFDRVADPLVPAQIDSWGCAGDEIEEITLWRSAHQDYRRAFGR